MKYRKKIFFIEDEKGERMMMKIRLEASGYQLISAVSGDNAVERVAAAEPDLLLLDILLPTVDGFQICKELKADKRTKDIPILVITAIASKDAEDRVRELGADDFVKKPYDAEELMAKIKQLCEKKTKKR